MPIRRESTDTSLRLVKLLNLIPKVGHAIGTKSLREKLAAEFSAPSLPFSLLASNLGHRYEQHNPVCNAA